MHKRLNLIGQKFGKLTVLSFSHIHKTGHCCWLCQCECNKKTFVTGSNLKNNTTLSCGCLHKESSIKNGKICSLPNGISAFNGLYSSYKTSARKRNFSFNLNKEEFKDLTQQNCFYCGIEPKNIFKSMHNTGNYIYNGIDRVDNNLSYIYSNCVPCCSWCNRMKSNYTQEEYFDHIKKIYDRRFISIQ